MSKLNTVAIIQARMQSSRLPNKVMLEIAGKPMLAWVAERTKKAQSLSQVWIATTAAREDDPIAIWCEQHSFSCWRGPMFDVLDRFYQTARAAAADVIVRITADCPLMDPSLIDETLAAFLKYPSSSKLVEDLQTKDKDGIVFPYDFAANRLPPPWGRTYPIGLDIEICTWDALEIAWNEARLPHQREHVMPFFYENPLRFRILHLNYRQNLGHLRWTVDTPEDLSFIRALFDLIGDKERFSWLDVLNIVQAHPELSKINAEVRAKDYRQIDGRSSLTGR